MKLQVILSKTSGKAEKNGSSLETPNQTRSLLLIRWRITSPLTDDPINGDVSNENVESKNQLKRALNKN